MIALGITLHTVLTNAYTLFTLFLGLWASYLFFRNRTLDGSYFGAIAVCALLAVAILVLTLLLALGGKSPVRWVYWLYQAFFIVVLPGTYSLTKGRDDRTAAGIYAAVAIFTFLASASRSELVFTTPLGS